MGEILQIWNVVFDVFNWAWNWTLPNTSIHPIQLTLTIMIVEVSLEALIPILYKSASSAVEKGGDDD